MSRRCVAIVGATATGKTALAVSLAQRLDGEIINADSRQIYRGMDVGTAKPTRAEQEAARHWLIDVVAPNEPFTLADFIDRATSAMAAIWSRGRMPIVCGGTGQYVWALLEGWRVPRVPPDTALRSDLEERAARDGTQALMDELRAIDPIAADEIDARNVRRMIRAIEVTRATGRPFSAWRTRAAPEYESTIIGLSVERPELYRRIDARVDAMIRGGLLAEVESLIAHGYGCELPAMSGIGYRQMCEVIEGARALADAVLSVKTETHRLARMQHSWFRRDDPRIRWLDADALDLIERAEVVAAATGGG